MQGDDYPEKDASDYHHEQMEMAHLEHILEEAEKRWAEEQAETKKRIAETFQQATSAGMNLHLWRAGLNMLGEMIDATENGDAIREDFHGDQVAQGILLEAFDTVRLAFDTVNGVLKEAEGLIP